MVLNLIVRQDLRRAHEIILFGYAYQNDVGDVFNLAARRNVQHCVIGLYYLVVDWYVLANEDINVSIGGLRLAIHLGHEQSIANASNAVKH